jgi:hypothetical protein
LDLAGKDEGLAAEDEGVAIQDKGLGFQGNLSVQNEDLSAEDGGLAAEDEGLAAEDEGLASIFFVAKFDKNLIILPSIFYSKIIKYTFNYNRSQRHFTKFVSNLRISQEMTWIDSHN